MKNIVFTVCFFFSFLTLGMSQFQFGAGAQLILDGTALGVQGKALYGINDDWGAAGGFTYYLEDGIDFAIDLDAHYLGLDVSDNFSLAPLAGISYMSFPGIDNPLGPGTLGGGSDTGINLGAFFRFGSGDGVSFYAEPKFRLGDGGDGLIISGGVLF